MEDQRLKLALKLHREQANNRRERCARQHGMSPQDVFERINAVPLQGPLTANGGKQRRQAPEREGQRKL